MLAIVRIALSKPYTFVVMAMLIVIFGVAAALRTPIDIFPNIGIPGRRRRVDLRRTARRRYVEAGDLLLRAHAQHSGQRYRAHRVAIDAALRRGQGLLPARASTSTRALAQIDRGLADRSEIPAAGNYAALRAELQRFERAGLQLALSSKSLSQAELADAGQNFIRPQLARSPGAAIPSPYGGKVLQVQVDIDQDKLQAYGLSAEDVVNAIGRQNIITPVGTEKVGDFEYVVALNGSPNQIDELNDMPIRVVNGATVFVRDVAYRA